MECNRIHHFKSLAFVCRLLVFGNRSTPIITALVFVLGLAVSDESYGTMFLCRDKSGTIHFTNVRNSSNCKAYSLSKSSSGYHASYPAGTTGGAVDRSRYDSEIRRVARRYDVDPPLIKAIIHTESDFNHRAVSKSGAKGLMQLMPETARELRVRNPFDPRENIDGGTRYFRKMLDNFKGNLILSLAAYNAGPGQVTRSGGVPRIAETRRYVNKVLRKYKFYKARM